ncbi:hypothetical protein K5X82_11030 [Halosquirtibacter xylanolyticus]|uniref:hypothetical protein n=1 Tax=Halosquirtibacter xylanolyticus TaxID=3374599 RepID=UPI00374A287F|nr:hypothetical protein K5X82_11030 [Prolixibacteraceae bacterium]
MKKITKVNNIKSLDPQDWDKTREIGYQMIDDMIEYLQDIPTTPSWNKIPDDVKTHLEEDIPKDPTPLEEVYDEFKHYILPYPKGNIYPLFWHYNRSFRRNVSRNDESQCNYWGTRCYVH